MIIGTAGHVDHGKSRLVEELTGQPMDPLAEERRRGITLDLHVAPLALSDGRVAGVVDVPGHEDLIRTMVAGAAGLDLVLLVIAADEGIMPQTREHLTVVEQLRVPAGIPVITKADRAQPERVARLVDEVSQWLRHSPVAFRPPVVTAAARGEGIVELRAVIAGVPAAAARTAADLFRMPIDRSLSLPGVGTVVTGTAWSGQLSVGDTVRLMPGGTTARVRSLERHGQPIPRSEPGERIAVALPGIERAAIRRGDVLVRAEDPWSGTSAIDVSIELAEGSSPLLHRTRLRVHLGTAEILARVQTALPITPGTSREVRLALEAPVLARGGDRLVLRSYSPVTTIGGGWVVDPLPPRGKPVWPWGIADPKPATRLVGLIERRSDGLETALLPFILGTPPGSTPHSGQTALLVVQGRLILERQVASAAELAHSRIRRHHVEHPAEGGLSLETLRQALRPLGAAGVAGLDRLLSSGAAVVEQGVVRETTFRPPTAGGSALVDRLVQAIEEAGLSPPSVPELEVALGVRGAVEALRLAARAGRVVAIAPQRYFAVTPLARFTSALAELGARGAITPASLRDALGLSRKYLIPLLEWADATGLTERRGDVRVLRDRRA